MAALDTLTAIYHRRSGQTHLVAAAVPAILAALDASEADLETLLVRLGLGTSDASALAERLSELAASGLVEAA